MRSYVFDKKEKSVFELLKNCISTDNTRPFLNHAYYDGKGCMYATTGYRLVKIESKRLSEKLGDKPGYFDVIGGALLESDFSRDPIDYERMIPSGEGEKFVVPQISGIKSRYIDSLIYAAVCHYTGKVFNPELFQGLHGIELTNIFQPENHGIVKFTGIGWFYYDVTFVAMATNTSFMNKFEAIKRAI